MGALGATRPNSCADGGTGIRARSRSWRRKARQGFDSLSAHFNAPMAEWGYAPGSGTGAVRRVGSTPTRRTEASWRNGRRRTLKPCCPPRAWGFDSLRGDCENSGRWRNPVDAADLNPAGPAVRVRLSRAPPVGRSFQLERRRSPKALFLVRVQVGPPPCVRRSMEEPRPSKPLGAGSIPVGRAIDALIAQLERVPPRGGGG